MTRNAVLFAAVVALTVPLTAQESGTWHGTIRAANAPAIVFIQIDIQNSNGTSAKLAGTGFIVHPDGYVLTCAHVIPQDAQIRIAGSVGGRYERPFPISVVTRDDTLDLALLKLSQRTQAWPYIAMCDPPPDVAVDSPVFVLGFPLDFDLTSMPGLITSMNAPNGRWTTDAALNAGTSGGPAFGPSGRVVAIARAGRPDAQRLNELIPAKYAAGLLGMIGRPPCPAVSAAKNPQPKTATSDLRVVPNPNTVTIRPGEYERVGYQFEETGGLDVFVESQDFQFFSLSGVPIGPKYVGDAIDSGSFKVRARSRYRMEDRVWLDPKTAAEARKAGLNALNLHTRFNCRDEHRKEFQITAILRVNLPVILTQARMSFLTLQELKDKNTKVTVLTSCGFRIIAIGVEEGKSLSKGRFSEWNQMLLLHQIERGNMPPGCQAELRAEPLDQDEFRVWWQIELTFSDGEKKTYSWIDSVDKNRPKVMKPLN